jgi:hypothetical protein
LAERVSVVMQAAVKSVEVDHAALVRAVQRCWALIDYGPSFHLHSRCGDCGRCGGGGVLSGCALERGEGFGAASAMDKPTWATTT